MRGRALIALAAGLAVTAGAARAGDAPVAPVATTTPLARSVLGRPIAVTRIGYPGTRVRRRVLVVGSVHGEEPAGRAIVARLAERSDLPAGVELLLVRNLNPDGRAAGTRYNAHGVDLNRNSREGWQPTGGPRDPGYPGPRPFSEPETRAIRALLLRERPDVVVWYHQPFGLVDVPETGWTGRSERYARLVGLPVHRQRAFPGSLSRWTNARVRPGSSFVIELPAGRLSAAAVDRHAGAVLALAAPGG